MKCPPWSKAKLFWINEWLFCFSNPAVSIRVLFFAFLLNYLKWFMTYPDSMHLSVQGTHIYTPLFVPVIHELHTVGSFIIPIPNCVHWNQKCTGSYTSLRSTSTSQTLHCQCIILLKSYLLSLHFLHLKFRCKTHTRNWIHFKLAPT